MRCAARERDRKVWGVLGRVLLMVLIPATVRAAPPQVETRADGAIRLHARDTTRADILRTMANEIGFEAVIYDGAAARRLPGLTVAAVSLEGAIHEVLRGCNYALFYDDGGELSRVVVLRRAAPGRAVRSLPPRRSRGKPAAPRGPLVIRQ